MVGRWRATSPGTSRRGVPGVEVGSTLRLLNGRPAQRLIDPAWTLPGPPPLRLDPGPAGTVCRVYNS